jgi:hypothetical protein
MDLLFVYINVCTFLFCLPWNDLPVSDSDDLGCRRVVRLKGQLRQAYIINVCGRVYIIYYNRVRPGFIQKQFLIYFQFFGT